MMRTTMMMIWVALMASVFAPAVGAVSPLEDEKNEYETTNEWAEYCGFAVLTADHPGFKSVRGRNFRKGMDDAQKADVIQDILESKQRATRKRKQRRNISFGAIALTATLALFDLTIGHALLSSFALVGATTLVSNNHRWTPPKDRNGNVWVERQSNIINHIMTVFESDPVEGIRLMVMACAGAGKTTLIAGICEGFKNAILENADYALSLSLIAFNKDIRADLDEIATAFAKSLSEAGVSVDWSGKTLNSWGWKMCDDNLKLEHPNGKVKSFDGNRSQPFQRMAIMNLLETDLASRNEWLNLAPRDKYDSNKADMYRAISKAQSGHEKLCQAAMNHGMLIEGSGFDWESFMALHEFDILISNDIPFGDRIKSKLQSTVGQAIRLSMQALTPMGVGQRIQPHDDARIWLWNEPNAQGKSIIAKDFNGNKYRAVKSWKHAGIKDRYLEWSQGEYRARNCSDEMLLKAGMLYEPETCQFVAGEDTSSNDNAQSIKIVQRYVGNGYMGSKPKMIQIEPSFHTTGTPFNDIIKSINYGNSYGSKVMGYGAIMGSKNYHQRASGLFPSNVGGNDWVYLIRDDDDGEVIQALCSRLKEHMDIDCDYVFSGATPSNTDMITGHVVRFDFTDQIYAPCYHNWLPTSRMDLVMVDEFQDMSMLKHMLIEKVVKPDGGIVCVGDSKQAIYRFAGSAQDSCGAGVERFGLTEMPMEHCFRQTHILSLEVRQLLGIDLDGNETRFMQHDSPTMIESWPVGEDSQVVTHEIAADMLEAGDMVLNSMGAQLVEMAMQCLSMGKRIQIAGGGKMESRIRSVSLAMLAANVSMTPNAFATALADDKAALLVKLTNNHNGDVAKAQGDEKMKQFEDTETSINALITQWFDSGSTTEFVSSDGKDWLQELFGDDDSEAIMFSTVHKAKGLEFDRVFILCDRLTQDEDGEDKPVSNWMWQWVCHDDAGIQEHLNLIYVAITRAKKQNVYVSMVGGGHPRDAMWVLDDYTQDHRTLGDDEGTIVDDNDDSPGDGNDDDDLVIDDEESVIDDESPENTVIDAPEEPETVEEVVEATPDATEATEMPKFAIIQRTTGFENQGVQHDCIMLTNDIDEVKAHLETVLSSDDMAQMKPGIYLQSVHNGFDLYSVWLTDYDLPEYVEIAINNYIHFNNLLEQSTFDNDDDDLDEADEGEDIEEPVLTELEIIESEFEEDIFDEIVEDIEGADEEPEVCKDCQGASGSKVIMQDTQGNSHGVCVPCWKGEYIPDEEVIEEPVIDDEPEVKRSRKDMESRVADLERAVNALFFDDMDIQGVNNPKRQTVLIADIANHMGCSVDTVKRVLEHMAHTIHMNLNRYNHQNGEAHYDDNGEWTTIEWLPEHEIDYQDRIVVKCQRSPTGRFKRHTDIEFRVMEFNHEVGLLGAKSKDYTNTSSEEMWGLESIYLEKFPPMPCPKCGEKLSQGSWHISDRGMGNSKDSNDAGRRGLRNDGLQPFIQFNVGISCYNYECDYEGLTATKKIDMTDIIEATIQSQGYEDYKVVGYNPDDMDLTQFYEADNGLTRYGKEPITEDLEAITEDSNEVGFTDADGDFYCECWENFKGNVGCDKCENKPDDDDDHDDDGGITEDSNDDDGDDPSIECEVCEKDLNDDDYHVEGDHHYCNEHVHIARGEEEPSGLERIFTEDSPEIDDESPELEPATSDEYDSRYGHHSKMPKLSRVDCTFGVKACRKVNRDIVVMGLDDIGQGVALETNDCVNYMVAKNENMQFVINNIEDMHIDQNEWIEDDIHAENRNWFGEVVAIGGNVAESVFSNKGSTSIAKIMGVPVATIHGGFQASGELVATAANLTKTHRLYDISTESETTDVIIRPMGGSFNAMHYQWGHNSDQSNTLHDMANFNENTFKKMVSNLMKGGKNPGDAHGYKYLRFFGTTIDAKSFKDFATALSGAKTSLKGVSLRIYNANYDGESSGHYYGHRLSIVGKNWSADFFNQDVGGLNDTLASVFNAAEHFFPSE